MNSDQDIFHFYELSRINDWIIGNDYKRIALQFPQDDLDIAPKIQEELERRLGNAQKLYILADTSYRRFQFLIMKIHLIQLLLG